MEQYIYGTAIATLPPCLSFSTDVGRTETNEEERNRGTQLLASITIPYDCVQLVQDKESAVCSSLKKASVGL